MNDLKLNLVTLLINAGVKATDVPTQAQVLFDFINSGIEEPKAKPTRKAKDVKDEIIQETTAQPTITTTAKVEEVHTPAAPVGVQEVSAPTTPVEAPVQVTATEVKHEAPAAVDLFGMNDVESAPTVSFDDLVTVITGLIKRKNPALSKAAQQILGNHGLPNAMPKEGSLTQEQLVALHSDFVALSNSAV